jgi:hypothetical protein
MFTEEGLFSSKNQLMDQKKKNPENNLSIHQFGKNFWEVVQRTLLLPSIKTYWVLILKCIWSGI